MNAHSRTHRALLAGAALLALSACGPGSGAPAADTPDSGAGTTLRPRLPTGVYLDPAGRSSEVGALPLAMVASPNGGPAVLLLNGYTTQGVQVIDRSTGAVLQTLAQPAAFLGLVFSPDGSALYASGGNQDVVYRYDWAAGRATLRDSLVIEHKEPRRSGRRYPAGIGVSPDGARLYVAENLTDSLSVVDLASGRVTQRLATGRYPYGVVVGRDGAVYVSAWGGNDVSVFTPRADGSLASAGEIPAGRHPSALLLNADGSRPSSPPGAPTG
jgi:YVTN family beta-propeller protein